MCDDKPETVDLTVQGIRLSGENDQPILLLEHQATGLVLPIWIGTVEAAAIALLLSPDEEFTRPLTHDLLGSVLEQVEATGHVEIYDMVDGLFYARLVLNIGEIEARPSDAVAVAVRMGWRVLCPSALLHRVGVAPEQLDQDEVDEFVAFLDQINADDFTAEE